jgi:type II secretory pathway pseudopilin PulG
MTARHATEERGPGRTGSCERGYALIALLAMMTLLMIATMAAAPSIRQQARRERELEAIARGEEVAEAIRMYIRFKGGGPNSMPTSMDELLEGVTPQGRTKKVKVLRASAARDPLSESGEWRTVKLRDEALIRFIRDISEYADGRTPTPTNDPALSGIQLPQLTGLITGIGSGSEESGGEDNSLSSSGPFIGVASRSRRESIITYYGIERHDRWVFTPFYR